MKAEKIRLTFIEQPCEITYEFLPTAPIVIGRRNGDPGEPSETEPEIDIKSIIVLYGKNERLDLFPLLSWEGIRMAQEAVDEFLCETTDTSDDDESNAFL
jgi:hypothetical protein